MIKKENEEVEERFDVLNCTDPTELESRTEFILLDFSNSKGVAMIDIS